MIKRLRKKLNNNVNLKEILTGSAVTFVLKMTGMLLGYIVTWIIARHYGAQGIGVYSLTLSVLMFFSLISVMGMNVSILRYVGQFNKSEDSYNLKLVYRYAVELVLPLSLLLALFLYLSADLIAENIFQDILFEPALKFAAIIVPFMALQTISIEFIRGLKQLKVSEFLRSVNRPLINLILLISLELFLVNKLLPLYSMGAGVVITSIIAVHYIVNKIHKIKREEKSKFTKKEFVLTSLPMMITGISSFIIGNISLYMLQVLATTEEVGIFSVALKVSTIISLILLVVNTMSAPKFSELYWAKKYETLQVVINHSTELIFLISLCIATVFIIFTEHILSLFGNEFVVGSFALSMLIVGQLINSFTGSVGVLLNMMGHQKVLSRIVFSVMMVNIILNYILIPVYGINAAAFISMLGSIFINGIASYYVKTRLKYTTYYRLW